MNESKRLFYKPYGLSMASMPKTSSFRTVESFVGGNSVNVATTGSALIVQTPMTTSFFFMNDSWIKNLACLIVKTYY